MKERKKNKDLAILCLLVSICFQYAGLEDRNSLFVGFYIGGYFLLMSFKLYGVVKHKKQIKKEFKNNLKYLIALIAIIPMAAIIQLSVKGLGEFELEIYKKIFNLLGNIFPENFTSNYSILVSLLVIADVAGYYAKMDTIPEDVWEIFSTTVFGLFGPCIMYASVITSINIYGVIFWGIITVTVLAAISKKTEVITISAITTSVIIATYYFVKSLNPIWIVAIEVIVTAYIIKTFKKNK